VGIDPLDDLPIKFENKAQNTMGRRMLWAKVDCKIPKL